MTRLAVSLSVEKPPNFSRSNQSIYTENESHFIKETEAQHAVKMRYRAPKQRNKRIVTETHNIRETKMLEKTNCQEKGNCQAAFSSYRCKKHTFCYVSLSDQLQRATLINIISTNADEPSDFLFLLAFYDSACTLLLKSEVLLKSS